MKIAFASDHGGYELKEKLITYYRNHGYDCINLGTNSEQSVDYPDFGFILGTFIANKNADLGIAICGTGIGISIACNKVTGTRAALVYDKNTAMLAKEHNNANIICLGGRTTSFLRAKNYINIFMETEFQERHQTRIDKITKFEKEHHHE